MRISVLIRTYSSTVTAILYKRHTQICTDCTYTVSKTLNTLTVRIQKTHTSWINFKASIWRLDGNQLRSLTFAHKRCRYYSKMAYVTKKKKGFLYVSS